MKPSTHNLYEYFVFFFTENVLPIISSRGKLSWNFTYLIISMYMDLETKVYDVYWTWSCFVLLCCKHYFYVEPYKHLLSLPKWQIFKIMFYLAERFVPMYSTCTTNPENITSDSRSKYEWLIISSFFSAKFMLVQQHLYPAEKKGNNFSLSSKPFWNLATVLIWFELFNVRLHC